MPKKGLEPAGIGSSFRFKKIPLSIEYTKLSLFSIPSTQSTQSVAWYGFRMSVDTITPKLRRISGHQERGSRQFIQPALQNLMVVVNDAPGLELD